MDLGSVGFWTQMQVNLNPLSSCHVREMNEKGKKKGIVKAEGINNNIQETTVRVVQERTDGKIKEQF
jgi:hypothetical protein